MKRKSNHVARPSGLTQSKDGKYIYANCVVTGKPTFFKPDYFATVLARFGGDEVRMAKEYVCKIVKDFRKRGFSDEAIKAMSDAGELVKPEKVEKAPKVNREKKAKVSSTTKQVKVKDVVTGEVKTEERITYPWQSNPNYFKSAGPGVIDWAEASKDTCHNPARFLDMMCEGCPFYSKCAYTGKYTDEMREAEQKKGRWKPKVRRVVWVAKEEIS